MIETYTNNLSFAGASTDAGLKKAAKLKKVDIISEVRDSGIRGRGGAGFPTGIKWNLAGSSKSDKKYVVCNADEGEPGTFKDRLILQEYADLVIEGMTIGARAISSDEGCIYLRGEYTYLLKSLEETLCQRRENNLLGENICGVEGFNFDIKIRLGAGAYVCGEETALIESMEGFRGEPRNRPPFPVDTGYMGKPTIVNNVETFAWIAMILDKGGKWFHDIGTDNSTGHKLLSVSGDCERPGVYEFPFGITVKEMLAEVGGSDAKAVQIGGASGVCVPASEFDRKIAYEDISTGGSVIVFGPGRDMLRVAKDFLEFFAEESCGQCTPCRDGNTVMLDGLHKLETGKCSYQYLKELGRLGETMQVASKCGLGQSAPNAFLSIIKNFPNEVMGRK